MKFVKWLVLLFIIAIPRQHVSAQANATVNVLTQNSGQVFQGGNVYIQVDVGNTGPTTSIGVNRVRVQVSVPSAIVSVSPNAQQDALPPGWTILTNTGSAIQVCNGSDIIPVNAVRTVLIKIQGNTIGGPSTVTGVLSFGPGTGVCTGPGSLPGDITADNTSSSTVQVIAAPPCTLGVTASAGSIACNGGSTTITATATGANGAVQYNINGGAFQSSNIFNVSAGTYTIVARQVNNPSCTATAAAVTVANPAVVAAPQVGTITQPTCVLATGSVRLSGLPSGNWTIDPGGLTGNTENVLISGLTPGTYSFSVTNSAGCTSASSASIVINAQSIPAAPTVSLVQPGCTIANGQITVTSVITGLTFSLDGGAFAPYPVGGYAVAPGGHSLVAMNSSGCTSPQVNFTINPQPPVPAEPAIGTVTQPNCIVSTGSVLLTGLPAGNWTINPGNLSGNTGSFTINGLAQGTYNFTVTNSAGCTSVPSAAVVIDPVPGSPPAPVVSLTQPGCAIATGIITVTSPTAGLTFSLDGGAYAAYPPGGYIVSPGTHTLVASNAGGCFSPTTTVVIDAQPPTPAAPGVSITQPTCTQPAGLITVSSSTAGLTFSLDGGSFAAYPPAGYTVSPGPHTLAARNAAGCTSANTNIIINPQPLPPAVTLSSGTIACKNGTTTLTATGSGGAGSLQYSLNGGAFQTGNSFTVGAGSYSVIVRDASLCNSSAATITVTEPTAITGTISAGTVACNGGTALLTVTAGGGTPPYQYRLNIGSFQSSNAFTVGAGNYVVTIRDANQCTFTTPVTVIAQPTVLNITARATRITECGGVSQINITATGGTQPYVSGAGNFTRGPGTWDFIVTDAAGCRDTATVVVEAPGCVELKITPNPATSNIIISHSAAEPGSVIRIFHSSGALVISKAVPANAFQTRVDVNRLSAGHYVVVYWNGREKKSGIFEKGTR